MPVNCSDLPSLLDFVDPRFSVRAVGRPREGGSLEVYFEDQLLEMIALPPGEWDLAAMLIQSAMRSDLSNWAKGCIRAVDLARGLYRRSGRGNSDPANVPRFVFRLRKSIAKAMAKNRHAERIPDPKNWSKWLVQHHSFFGYRIGLPPGNLGLEDLGEGE